MTESTITLPLPLRHAIESGECILFLGAGIGKHLIRGDGKCLPDASGLAKDLAKYFSLDTDSDDLSKVAELIQIRGKRNELEDFIRKEFSDLNPDEDIKWLCSRKWRAIFTTNYDRGIERGYELTEKPPQTPVSINRTSDLTSIDLRFEIPIYHIHGAIFGSKNGIVISQSDYTKFRSGRKMLFEILKEKFSTSTVLYIGYSNRDPNWSLILNEITEEFQPTKLPPAFRVVPDTNKDDAEILKFRGIEVIDGDLKKFVASASVQLEAFTADDSRLKSLKNTIPNYFADVFEQNPAPVARLVSSWQYVNQANFSDEPNTHQFFRGDHPNWSLIGSGLSFQRDIEYEIYEATLDYITSDAKKPIIYATLGPAGYGITTLLMNLAARFVNERVGPVYFLKPGADMLEGDIEYAVSLAGQEVPCFIVDHASDNADQLLSIVSRLRDSNKQAIFICGSRMNEWRQRNIRLQINELELYSLSDTEIDNLLDCLGNSNELNKLEPLSRELQQAVIREKHGKELLVAMRESTEGNNFDAILENEFYGIEDEQCKHIYLIACCFHQYGNFIRTELICSIANLNLADFHNIIKDKLDGILISECIDEANGLYAYRTRHRLIANIVWSRCSEKASKNEIIQKSIEHLNLLYRHDLITFEKFVRDDNLIDDIHGLESKIKFFESACKKDPENPYTRQHYARMLYREGKTDIALSQIEQGLSIKPHSSPRVLFHTKGLILGSLALSIENKDIGRRRLVQAEEVFSTAIKQSTKDSYAYQSLARLYLDWVRHCNSADERTTYLTKAEEVLSQGLSLCHEKDRLWLVSAEISKWLGDQPEQLRALETAVKDSPGSIIARYMLGKHYRSTGQFKHALEILEPNIKNHLEEFRSFIEYALALWESGGSLRESIAVLEISSTAGMSDARYISYLGGMMFLNGDYSNSTKIFHEAKQRISDQSELHRISFLPIDPGSGEKIRLTGKVIARKPQFSLIEAEGYPAVLCHSSNYRGIQFTEGMHIMFSIGFSPKGATAIEPKKVQ